MSTRRKVAASCFWISLLSSQFMAATSINCMPGNYGTKCENNCNCTSIRNLQCKCHTETGVCDKLCMQGLTPDYRFTHSPSLAPILTTVFGCVFVCLSTFTWIVYKRVDYKSRVHRTSSMFIVTSARVDEMVHRKNFYNSIPRNTFSSPAVRSAAVAGPKRSTSVDQGLLLRHSDTAPNELISLSKISGQDSRSNVDGPTNVVTNVLCNRTDIISED